MGNSGSARSASANQGRGPLLWLTGIAFGVSLLALFQWMEFLVALRGGSLSCSISQVLDCAKVWSSDFAKSVHSTTGMPIAGFGLVWGIGAFFATLRAWARLGPTGPVAEDVHVLRVFAAMGLVTSAILAGVSMSVGSWCLTCLGTYALILLFVFQSLRFAVPLRTPASALLRSMAWAGVYAGAAFVALYYPGKQTPTSDGLSMKQIVAAPADDHAGHDHAGHDHAAAEAPPIPKTLPALLDQLPSEAQQALSDSLGHIRRGTVRDRAKWPVRFRLGAEAAPVQIVKFTDIRCGHCARLMAEFAEIKKLFPEGTYAVEPRQFPLDAECNKKMNANMTDGSGIRCTAAKALICLESKPEVFERVQLAMFQEQDLTKDRVLALAGEGFGDRAALEACVASNETATRLEDDIAFARSNEILGTPLVLINGREVEPVGLFLYAMILAKGDPNAPEFSRLPPPRPEPSLGPQAGGHP